MAEIMVLDNRVFNILSAQSKLQSNRLYDPDFVYNTFFACIHMSAFVD